MSESTSAPSQPPPPPATLLDRGGTALEGDPPRESASEGCGESSELGEDRLRDGDRTEGEDSSGVRRKKQEVEFVTLSVSV